MTDFMDRLNIDGWRAVLFVKSDDTDTCEEDPDMQVGDPAVVRREQWIVAGGQYVFAWKDEKGNWQGPELGEFEAEGREKSGKGIDGLEDLLPLVRRRLEAGEPRESMHPVLLALL